MKFCEKVKEARTKAGLKQDELAKAIGVSLRTISNYEAGTRYPKKRETYYKMAEVLKVDVNYLLTDDEEFLLNAESKYGSKGARQAKELMAEVTGLFAGGELADEDLDEMMKGIQEAYWIAKEKNKKYTPKKYRKKRLMSSFSDSVFDKIYLLAVEWGCLLLDIQTLEIVRKANRLTNELGTNDPHKIARELGIEVIPLSFKKQRGAYKVLMRNSFNFIKDDLHPVMERIVMLHEIGHDALHREEAVKAGGFKEFNIFDMRQSRMEYEANIFASQISLPDDEILEYIENGYDIQQIARAMHSDINLVALKTDTLIAQGYRFRHQEYRNQFLK